MDTELARTFLTVVTSGSFVGAADVLHVTQSTVSARIRTLEDHLGCTLLVRNRAGVTLTASGRQFQKHAVMLVRTAEQARQAVGVPPGFTGSLAIGGRFGLWEQLLLTWVQRMRDRAPAISVRAEIGFESDLMQGLVDGRLDIGVMYTPQSRPGLTVEKLLDERLILVSTERDAAAPLDGRYVYVDWGPEFYARHSAAFPRFDGPALTVNIGWLGVQTILDSGGAGYFPARLVRQHIAAGRLFRCLQAPDFSLPAYVVFPDTHDDATVGPALALMRDLATADCVAADLP